MIEPTTKMIASANADQAIGALVLAFSADPAARWLYPDPHEYLIHFPRFVRAFAGKAFAAGSVCCVDDYRAAALWLPPNVHADEEEVVSLIEQTVRQQDRNDVFAVLEQMGHYHPSEPHWYLPLIGVDPTQQGKGFGSALLTHALIQCDRDHKLAYLESSSPKNIPLYERHRFELIGTIQVGSSPPIFPMLRRPR